MVFGGPDYADIYVTTAGGDQKETEGPGAGALFRLRLGIRGVAEFPSPHQRPNTLANEQVNPAVARIIDSTVPPRPRPERRLAPDRLT